MQHFKFVVALVASVMLMCGTISLGEATSPTGKFSVSTMCADLGIVLGQRIGPFAVGESLSEVRVQIGRPDQVRIGDPEIGKWHPVPDPGVVITGWADAYYGPSGNGIKVRANHDTIVLVALSSPSNCVDPYHIGIGSPGRAIIASYGHPDAQRGDTYSRQVDLVYNSSGIAFALANATGNDLGTIKEIMVYTPGGFCQAVGKRACATYTPPLR